MTSEFKKESKMKYNLLTQDTPKTPNSTINKKALTKN